MSNTPFDQRSLIHREAWFPPCFVRQNRPFFFLLFFCVFCYFFRFQKNWVFGYFWSTLLWYRCFYPHRLRDALSPVSRIFFFKILLRMCLGWWGLMGLSGYFKDFCWFFPYLFDETPWRPKIKSKKCPFWFTLNWTAFEWQGAIFFCINQVNSGRARAVPKTIVT